MAFTHIFHPDTKAIAEVPDETVEHWATLGWQPVPEEINLADRQAVDEFLAGVEHTSTPDEPMSYSTSVDTEVASTPDPVTKET